MSPRADASNAVRLAVELQLGRQHVELDQRLAEDLGADSFDLMNIVVGLEEDRDITISEQDAARIRTVGDLVRLITSLEQE